MRRRASRASPITATELDFLGRIVTRELWLNDSDLKSELRRRVLGRGNRLEIRFGLRGVMLSVGNTVSSELEDPAFREMWGDILGPVHANPFSLVLVRVVVSLPAFNLPSQEVIAYCSAKRPRWLPVAL
jgi:hypothetical protein